MHFHQEKRQNKQTSKGRANDRQSVSRSFSQSMSLTRKKEKKIVANTNSFLPLSTTGAIRRGTGNWTQSGEKHRGRSRACSLTPRERDSSARGTHSVFACSGIRVWIPKCITPTPLINPSFGF